MRWNIDDLAREHRQLCAGTATPVFVPECGVAVPAQDLSMNSGWLVYCVDVPAQMSMFQRTFFVDVPGFPPVVMIMIYIDYLSTTQYIFLGWVIVGLVCQFWSETGMGVPVPPDTGTLVLYSSNTLLASRVTVHSSSTSTIPNITSTVRNLSTTIIRYHIV